MSVTNTSNLRGKQSPSSKGYDLKSIDKEIDKLHNANYGAGDDDERDETIEKLKNVNEILRNKVKDLEQIVQNTIGKHLDF